MTHFLSWARRSTQKINNVQQNIRPYLEGASLEWPQESSQLNHKRACLTPRQEIFVYDRLTRPVQTDRSPDLISQIHPNDHNTRISSGFTALIRRPRTLYQSQLHKKREIQTYPHPFTPLYRKMSSSSHILPPIDNSQTILEALDFHVENNADQAMYIYSENTEDQKITSISYLEFTRATHRIAHTFRPNHQGAGREVVGVIMLVDSLLYQATTVGLMRAGLTVSSPRPARIASPDNHP